jgi:hypothetical protein
LNHATAESAQGGDDRRERSDEVVEVTHASRSPSHLRTSAASASP